MCIRDRNTFRLCEKQKNLCKTSFKLAKIVNNGSKGFPSNVAFHELNLGPGFDPGLKIFLPNVHWESVKLWDLRIVLLLATRDIPEGEELYSEYFSAV